MGHYYSEMHYEGKEEDMRRIDEKYARMSQKEKDKIRRDMWLSIFKENDMT